MKLTYSCTRRSRQGYALMVVLVLMGAALVVLSGTMTWTSQNARLTDRNNEYYVTAAAAEAASEKILVRISRDYLSGGEPSVYNNLGTYRGLVPTSSDNSYWSSYLFSNPESGATNATYVGRVNPFTYVVLDGQYKGLNGFRATYRISSNARLASSRNGITAGVRQDVGVESIPLFQFAIFYSMDMEINPSPNMTITGRVHGNGDIFTVPSATLTFSNDVTASGTIYKNNKPGDPQGMRGITNPNVVYKAEHDSGTSTLNLPIGTNNTPENVYQVIKMPPADEDMNSVMGTNRYYNQCDLLVTVYNPTNFWVTNGYTLPNGVKTNAPAFPQVFVTNGVRIASSGLLSSNEWAAFLNLTNGFYDAREAKTIRPITFDVGKFRSWAEAGTNAVTPHLTGKSCINMVYLADLRTFPIVTCSNYYVGKVSGTNVYRAVYLTNTYWEPAVRLTNGARVPKAGLTLATCDPLYVQGNFNVTTNSVAGNYSTNTYDTRYTLPCSLVCDSFNVLSSSWDDDDSTSWPRSASTTTVNAAVMSGIVPTGNGYYSGGVENFPRFLEDWSGDTLWYNGSIVGMFYSQIGTAAWGSGVNVYNPPTRNWSFDKNFYDITKMPPGTPQILFMERVGWALRSPTSN